MSVVENGHSPTPAKQLPILPTFEVAQWSLDKKTGNPEASQRLDRLFRVVTKLFVDKYATHQVETEGRMEMRHPYVVISTDDIMAEMFDDPPSTSKERTLAFFKPGHKRVLSDAVMNATPILDAVVKARLAGVEVEPIDFVFSGYPDNYGGGISLAGNEQLREQGFKYYGDADAELVMNVISNSGKTYTRITAAGESQGSLVAGYTALALKAQGQDVDFLPLHVPGKGVNGTVRPGEQVQITLGRYTEKAGKAVVRKMKGIPDQAALTDEFIKAVAPTLAERGIINDPDDRKHLLLLSWTEKIALLQDPHIPDIPGTSETKGVYDFLNMSSEKWINYFVRRRRVTTDGERTTTLTRTIHSPLTLAKEVVTSLAETAFMFPATGAVVDFPQRTQNTRRKIEAA